MESRAWSPSETRCLIAFWAEESVQRNLVHSYHNRTVYAEISQKMKQRGYSRSWLQCQRKIKHLKYMFRKANCSNNESGRKKSICPYYDELDRVLGDSLSSCPDEGHVRDPLKLTSNAITDTPAEPDDNSPRDGFLPLSSLRLIVPPLQLVSAALWEILKQGAVKYYGLLEEFVTTVLETMPELLTYREKMQLLIGLRARVVLELCRGDFAFPQSIQSHLTKLNDYITKQDNKMSGLEENASVTNFVKLVHTLVDDQDQRTIFYEKIFPTVFGPKYNSALQAIMRKFLLNLQKLLPVPNFEQTSLWLSLSPATLKECTDLMNQPEHLNTLIEHHKHHGPEDPQALPSAGDDCILSSLSCQLPKVEGNEGDPAVGSDSICFKNLHENKFKKEKEESFEEAFSEMAVNAETNEHCDDLTEQGAFIEVILQPFEESIESKSDDDIEEKGFQHLKTHRKRSSRILKCLVCCQALGSQSKLKRHQSKFHPEPEIPVRNYSSENKNGLPSVADASTRSQKNLNNHTKSELSSDSLVCQEKVEKHQSICVVSNEQQMETDTLCFTRSVDQSQPNPAVTTEEPLLNETDTEPSVPVLQQSISCREVFTCSADLTRPVSCHTEQITSFSSSSKHLDESQQCETHQEDKCRVSNQHLQEKNESMQESSLCKKKKKNKENRDVLKGTVVADTLANPQASKSRQTCQECGQRFTYSKCFEQHQRKCSIRSLHRKKRENSNLIVINACNFQSVENVDKSHAENGSESKEGEAAEPPSSSDGSLTKSRRIKCTMCKKNFPKVGLLNKHYLKSHQVRGAYPCPVCKRTFVRLSELLQHHQNKKMYQCSDCQKCYSRPSLLSSHKKLHSASPTPRTCETCGKSFKYLAHLVLHQRKHREESPYICSYCGKQYSTKDCLKAHMVRHTGGYSCPVCGKKFYQRTYLKWHQYKHTGNEPYLCDTCGTGWPSPAQLKIHMIKHTEERPFKCEYCGACFKRGFHLMAHNRSKHVKRGSFVCDICSKAFRSNHELKKHMTVHMEKQPFTCLRCGKTFSKIALLRSHKKKACV